MLYTVNTKTPYHHFSGDKELFYVLSNLYVLIFRNGSHHSIPPFSAGTLIARC